MNDFLNREYFNNTIEAYIIVFAIILFVFLVKRYIAHYVAGLIFNILKRSWKSIDKISFRTLVAKPLGLFLAVLITVAALNELQFPQELDFNIYHIPLRELIRMMGTGLLIITFFSFVIKCIDFIVLVIKDRYLHEGDKGRSQLLFFFKDFIKVLVGIIAIMLILKYSFGYDVKGLVTGLSIVGAAIALALKESLENLIASFIIFFDKPFATGDVVKVNNISGSVEKIGLRSTRIRSDAKTYITVPNKQMVDSILENQSNRTFCRADLKLELTPSTSPDKVKNLLEGIKLILQKEEIVSSSVFLNDISASAIIINCEYYTTPSQILWHNNLKQLVNIEALQLMEKLDIKIAGKGGDVKMAQPT
jgi:MscS family membrane protein